MTRDSYLDLQKGMKITQSVKYVSKYKTHTHTSHTSLKLFKTHTTI